MTIKVRTYNLNYKLTDLLDEVRKRGYPTLDQSLLSRYINGRVIAPQAQTVLALCEEILQEWETEAKAAAGKGGGA